MQMMLLVLLWSVSDVASFLNLHKVQALMGEGLRMRLYSVSLCNYTLEKKNVFLYISTTFIVNILAVDIY